MHQRAKELSSLLGLQPHPEGGRYREFHRSPNEVEPADRRGPRSAITLIVFLLCEGEVSRWHRVLSDEIWHFHEGAPLALECLDDDGTNRRQLLIGPVGPQQLPVGVVPAGSWQAARSTGGYTLVSCTVGPGFDFADFSLLADEPVAAGRLRRSQPDLDEWL